MKHFERGIAMKLGACLVASAVAIFTALGYWSLELQRQGSEELILQGAERVNDLIKSSTRYQMLENDREGLYHSIREIGRQPGIESIRILNQEGAAMFCTKADDPGCEMDENTEPCGNCHAGHSTAEELARSNRLSSFTDAKGKRIAATLRPIENEPSCSSAPCHAHPASQTILGMVDARVNMDVADAQAARQRALLARFMLAAVAVFCLVSLAFVWAVLHRPIQDLTNGIERVARGDLEYSLTIRSRDELGRVAESFNKMTLELSDARTRLLMQTHDALARGEQMAQLGRLSATVAHEVNNPLFGILTYAKLCVKDVEASRMEPGLRARLLEQLEIIARESRRCGEILRNLLSFARQAPRHRDLNDFNSLVNRASLLMRHHFEMQHVTVETHLAADLPPVECDGSQIQQVVLVLLVNASEAMAEGGTIRIATESSLIEPSVRLRVGDSGPGIPSGVLPHIFEPFFTTKDSLQSTGMGLAVAKGILDQHGGSIQVRSKEGAGTEFVVTLPVQQAAQPPQPAAAAYAGFH